MSLSLKSSVISFGESLFTTSDSSTAKSCTFIRWTETELSISGASLKVDVLALYVIRKHLSFNLVV